MTSASLRPPLVRPRRAVLGGVSVSLATHLRLPVGAVRTGLVCLTAAGGAGALFYLWLWAFVPLEPLSAAAGTPVSRRVPVAIALVAVATACVLGELGGIASNSGAAIDVALVGAILGAGGAVAWSLAMDPADPDRSRAYATAVRSAATFVLLFGGIATLLTRAQGFTVVLGLIAIVVAVGVLVAPRMVSLWTTLMDERAGRVREEQRAEIAAHLHDSVLQTLALIQTRAGASTEVARIARAQERELRDWLFAEDVPARADLPTELREIAAAIELDYAARIDVVAVGAVTSLGLTAVTGAAREAMLNAARHAGGDVSVYVETAADSIDVFVRDRGPGVDMAGLPHDRLGIRESIIGRIARAGGIATVKAGAGGVGTEVHLHLASKND
jgi:signal transduction histidine kinase